MDLGDLIQFLVVDCDSDAARFLLNTYEGAQLRRRRVQDEASGEVGVQDGAAVEARSCENSTMEC